MGGAQEAAEVQCPPRLVGKVIGSGGQQIRTIEQESGARVQVNRDDGKVVMTGTADQVRKAKELVDGIIASGNNMFDAKGGKGFAPPGAGGGGNSNSLDGDPDPMGAKPNVKWIPIQSEYVGLVCGKQ